MKAMILAAGRGTRMAPLTDHCPKPLLPLAGKPLIQHHIEKLVAAGIDELVINHAYLGHMIEQQLGDGSALACRIRYSAESRALETAGGILQALPLLGDEPFVVINGDVWCDWDYRQLFSRAQQLQHSSQDPASQDLGWLALVANPEHHPEGDFGLQQGRVLAQPDHCGWTFAGISVLSPQLFAGLQPGEQRLAPLLRAAMADGRIAGEVLNAGWVDVGTPQRLQQLEQQLLAGQPVRSGGRQ